MTIAVVCRHRKGSSLSSCLHLYKCPHSLQIFMKVWHCRLLFRRFIFICACKIAHFLHQTNKVLSLFFKSVLECSRSFEIKIHAVGFLHEVVFNIPAKHPQSFTTIGTAITEIKCVFFSPEDNPPKIT